MQRIAKPLEHAHRDRRADLMDRDELLDRRLGQLIDAAEMAREDLCITFTDVADVDAVEKAL